MTLRLRYAAHSEIGLVRKNNQDSGYASDRLLVVADGMGGAAAGDLASATAIQQVRRADRTTQGEPITGERMLELLAGTLHQANEKIADLVAADQALDGMGTTVTSAMFDGRQLGVVHIGDSRAYLQRGNALQRLTRDHSWVQSLVDEGKLSAEEAAYHPHRSLLLKVLNGQPQADPDTSLVDVEKGDRLLFCSDGLCGLVEDDELAETLTAHDDLDDVLDDLIDAAHREGGIDNITIIVADVIEPDVDGAVGADQQSRVVGSAVDREIPVVAPRTADDETTIIRPAATRPPGAEVHGTAAPASVIASEKLAEEDAEAMRYAPTLRPRRRLWRGVLAAIIVVGLLSAGLGAGYAWSRTQYYVGPFGDHVAIHRGLSQTVLGVPLSDVFEVQDVRIEDLPPFYRDRVMRTISLHSLDEARRTTSQLEAAADRCIEQRAAQANPPAPSPTPGLGQPGEPTPVGPVTPDAPETSTPADPDAVLPAPTGATTTTAPLDPSEVC